MLLEVIIWTVVLSGIILGIIDVIRGVGKKKEHHYHVMREKRHHH